jgi:hypothetical protein
MTSRNQNETAPTQLSRQEEEKLLALWKQLKDFEKSGYPAVRAGCEKARNEMWQVLFELGLIVGDEE